MKQLKGQYFSFDAIIASVIFILALVSLLSYWNSARNALDFQNGDLTNEALRISELAFAPASCIPADGPLSFGNPAKTAIQESAFDCPQRQALTMEDIQTSYQTPFRVSIHLSDSQDAGFDKWVGEPLPAEPVGTVAHVQRIVRIERLDADGDIELSLGILDVYVYPQVR